jgi:ABC-type branched-subunit amino acid transport system substrate-binding protein/cytochrome c553
MARFGFLLLLLFISSAWSNARSNDEHAGRRLYLEGITPSGEPLRALIGYGQTPLSGQAVACGNCHGADGKGRAEGGVLPAQIDWDELTKSYGHTHPGGRRHGPFSETSFRRAVNEGLDPAGNRLDWAMPRYALSRGDAEVLIAHLKRLGEERAPGVGEARLRIGTILPEAKRVPPAGAMRAALAAYVEKVNRAGGLHQRKLELVVAGDYREARERFGKEPVFALVSPFEPEHDDELRALVEETRLPVVGALTGAAATVPDRDSLVFRVVAGLAEEAAVLVDFAAQRAGNARLRGAVVASGAPADEVAAQAALRRCAARSCGDLARVGWYAARFDAEAAVRSLKEERRQQLFFFGAQEEFERLLEVAASAADSSWRPSIHAAGSLARAALAARERFPGEIFLVFPTPPAGRAMQELRREFSLPAQYQAAQQTTLAAAAVFVEGLRRAGRDLSRERFVQALESLNNYEPGGFGPPVSFGPDRRNGVRGGYVVAVERGRGIVPASSWMSLD